MNYDKSISKKDLVSTQTDFYKKTRKIHTVLMQLIVQNYAEVWGKLRPGVLCKSIQNLKKNILAVLSDSFF